MHQERETGNHALHETADPPGNPRRNSPANSPADPPADPPVAPARNIDAVARLEKQVMRRRSAAARCANAVTEAAGSTPFLVVHVAWFTGWILANVGLIPHVRPFDPFPFSFLTLVVSLEAIFLTLLVLMSQNRIMKEADQRAHLNMQIDMLAEQEGTVALQLLKKISQHLGVPTDTEDKRLDQATDLNQLAREVDRKLGK